MGREDEKMKGNSNNVEGEKRTILRYRQMRRTVLRYFLIRASLQRISNTGSRIILLAPYILLRAFLPKASNSIERTIQGQRS